MKTIDLDLFRNTPLVKEPFAHLVVPGFIRAEARAGIHATYPRIDRPGSFPLSELTYGPAFAEMVSELEGAAMRQAFEEKFGLDLSGRPTMITARGHSWERDGHIHTDAVTKIITVLIYMNPSWEQSGGRLRLLRSPLDLEDVITEVSPGEGTMLAFRRTDNSWHGHKCFVGPRRVVQFNWVTTVGTVRRELWRHRFSALMKGKVPLGWTRVFRGKKTA
jgi:SM-20-related protein